MFSSGGGGETGSHSSLVRIISPLMIGLVYSAPEVTNAARVSKPERSPSGNVTS